MMTITYDRTVQTRMAFAGRRRELLANWLVSHSLDNAQSRAYWAEQMELANDAEIAVFTVLENVPF